MEKWGYKIQFTFNSEKEATLNQAENQKLKCAQEIVEETLSKIKYRNKLIKVADTSEGGLETVKQYQTNSLARDSEDEK